MLFESIMLGSKIYHDEIANRYPYDPYLLPKHNSYVYPQTITHKEVKTIRTFVNSWGTRSQWSVEELEKAIKDVQGNLNYLGNSDIITIDLLAFAPNNKDNHGNIIEKIFQSIATCGPRYESTGTSKVLHMLNPQLFVMWNSKIRGGMLVPMVLKHTPINFCPGCRWF